MYSEFEIHHKGGDLLAKLRRAFGPHDADVLAQSQVPGIGDVGDVLELYATQTRNRRLIFYAAEVDQLQVIVEPLASNVRQSSQSAWRTIRRASRWQRLELASVRVIDPATGDTFATAETGLKAAIATRELWPALVAALFTAVWLAVSLSTFARNDVAATGLGAVPAIVSGILALLALRVLRTHLIWHVAGWS